LALTGLLVPGAADAASCKIDGVWYDYDSPQCSPLRDNDPAEQELPPPVQPPLLDSQSSKTPPIPSGAAAYLRPWNEVALAALERCKKMEHPAMADSCRRKEEMAYWAMHGNFDMPPDEAAHAKTLCMSKTNSFEGQSACMQGESRGYSTVTSDLGMPVAYASKARAECSQQHESWSIRSSCMMSAKDRYKKGPESRSVRPPNAKVYSMTVASEHQPPPGYSRQSGTVGFTVNPELDEVRNRALKPTIPQPIHISQRAYLIGVRSEDYPDFQAFEQVMETRSSTVLFSPARPFIDGVGSLSFSSPLFVNPERNLATLRSEDAAKVFLHLGVCAVALIDEAETARYVGRRFSVA
jgi:hypothetical protein